MENEKIALKVSLTSIIVNVFLTIIKLFAGVVGHSSAMISDAIHSASDVLSTFVVIIGVKFSNKEADANHPYGHERLECVAAIILAIMLAATGLGIGISAIQKISKYKESSSFIMPTLITLFVAVISIVTKEILYWYTRGAAKKINSGALMADAWHHRSDALSSIASFIGVFGARHGFPLLDPITSVVICLFVLKVSFDIFKDAIDKMLDKSCDQETIEHITNIILKENAVINIDDLKTRLFGDKIYIDIEIGVAGHLPLIDAHEIANNVHDNIESSIPLVKHCMVHVNPK